MRSKFSIIIDTIVLFLVLWLLFFAWIRFYTRLGVVSAILGAILAILITFLVYFLNKKHTDKINLTKLEKEKAEKLLLNLNFSTLQEKINFFSQILSNFHKVEQKENYLILSTKTAQKYMHSIENNLHNTEIDLHSTQNNNTQSSTLNANKNMNMHTTRSGNEKSLNQKTLFIPFFNFSTFDMKELSKVINIANSENVEKITICTTNTSEEAKNFCKQINNFSINFIDTYKFYDEYAKTCDITLTEKIDITKPKMKYKELLAYAFNSARARNYLLFGLIIILSSFLVPFKIYYLVTGSILCIIALIIKVYPLIKREEQPNKKIESN